MVKAASEAVSALYGAGILPAGTLLGATVLASSFGRSAKKAPKPARIMMPDMIPATIQTFLLLAGGCGGSVSRGASGGTNCTGGIAEPTVWRPTSEAEVPLKLGERICVVSSSPSRL